MPKHLRAVEAAPRYSNEMAELHGQLKTSLDAFDLIDSGSMHRQDW